MVRRQARRRTQRGVVSLAVILAVILALGLVGCAGHVPIDPRDEMESREPECDMTSSMIELKVRNRSSLDVLVYLQRSSGGGRNLRPAAPGLKTVRYKVARSAVTRGYARLTAVRGGMASRPAFIQLGPVQCDVGTVNIAPSLGMSMFFGADV